jgi:hypothetical protein
MNDARPAGRELQDQVRAAAREGQKRVARTVKNVTATAQQIRPQLPNLSDVHITIVRLPSPAQLREKTPELIGRLPKPGQIRSMTPDLISRLPNASQLRERTPEFIARLPLTQLREQAARLPKLPSTSQIKVGAEEVAIQFRTAQHQFAGQVRDAATPLAKQVLAQVSAQAERLSRGLANGAAASKAAASELADTSDAESATKAVPVRLVEPAEPDTEAAAKGATASAKTATSKTTKSATAAKSAKSVKSATAPKSSSAAKSAAASKSTTSQARRAGTTRKPTGK